MEDLTTVTEGPFANRWAGQASLLLGRWDDAIARLEAESPATNRNDLASAYYMRGLERQSLADFERAYQTLSGAGDSIESSFNRALILERLCDREAAASAWSAYLALDSSSEWATEARQHLDQDTRVSAAEAWQKLKISVARRATAGDTGIAGVIDEYRLPARVLVERELLPQWAASWNSGARAGAREPLNAARFIAATLSAKTGERMLVDAVQEVESAVSTGGPKAADLALTYLQYRDGRDAIDRAEYDRASKTLDCAWQMAPRGGATAAMVALQAARAAIYQYDYTRTEQIIEETSAAYQARRSSYHALYGQLSWLSGLIHIGRKEPSEALRAYQEALNVYERLSEIDYQAAQHVNMADSLSYLGETERAGAHRYAAFQLLNRVDDPRRLHSLLSEAADAALDLSLPAAALVIQNRLVRISESSRVPLLIADSLVTRSSILLRLGERARALADVERARTLAGRIDEAGSRGRELADVAAAEAHAYREVDDARAVASLSRAIELYAAINFKAYVAQLLLERGRAQLRLGDRLSAESDFRAGIGEMEAQRSRVAESDLRIAYFDRAEGLFVELARMMIGRGQLEQAFDLLERARARELLDASTGTPIQPLTLAEIRRRLPAGVLLVAQTPARQTLITCLVSRERVEIFERPGGEMALTRHVDALSEAFHDWHDLPRADLDALGVELVQPLSSPSGERIVFIPDGVLHRVPFAALPEGGRYLVEQHAIVIAPSATLFIRNQERDQRLRARGKMSVLLLASPQRPSGLDRLEPVVQAAAGSARVASLYPDHRRIVAPEEPASSLLSIARQYDVIDFAGHAVVNDENPSWSSLFWGEKERIDASAIQAARLDRTRLVILGGCSTSIGTAHSSEGALSLARSFLATSVPAVVGTIARVDDPIAARLVDYFHAAYARDPDAASALRDAQLRMLGNTDRKLTDPTNWAAFEVVGGVSTSTKQR